MILTPHILIGAALGANLPPATLFLYLLPFAAVSLHYALDRVPHYDYKIYPFSLIRALKILLDLTFGILTIWLIYRFFNPTLNIPHTALGAFFGILPDGFSFLSFIIPWKLFSRYQYFHNFFHHKKKAILLISLLTQIITFITAIYFLI